VAQHDPEKQQADAVLNAVFDAHRGSGSEIDRELVAPRDHQQAERAAELAEIHAATEKAKQEARDHAAVLRYLEGD
jgi:hypothetical protein